MIRVLICDDQPVVCEGLQVILDTEPDIQVVDKVYDGLQAIAAVAQYQPDLVLMDLKMPRMNGIMATRQIHEQHPEVRVLVLTTYDNEEWVIDAIRAGAAGYVLKDLPRAQLIAAIRGTINGETHIDPTIAGALFAHVTRHPHLPSAQKKLPRLTERERDVLQLIVHGLSNAGIAEHLHLSEGTVRNYISAILLKLEVPDRTQAVIKAIRAGIVQLDEPDKPVA